MLLAEEPRRSHLDLHRAEASSVIVHNVAPQNEPRFLEWMEGITAAAESFPGYQNTEIYPPADKSHPQWVVVVHFDELDSLDRWLESTERKQWVAKLDRNIADYKLKTLSEGFGPWFGSDFAESPAQMPAGWKMALSVWLGLYPTVMLLSIFVGPYLNPLGFAVAMLISNALSVSILQWLVMPALTRVLKPWLNAPVTKSRRGLTISGLIGIGAVLAGLAATFRLFTG